MNRWLTKFDRFPNTTEHNKARSVRTLFEIHDHVTKWKHFPRYRPFVRGMHRSAVNSPHKGQCRGALIFSLICVWVNGWVNNGEAGDLRRYHSPYNVTVKFGRSLISIASKKTTTQQSAVRAHALWDCTVYPNKYAHGFCFAVLCCGYTLTDFPVSIRLTSLALWQSNDCPSASKATLMNMDKYFMWIHYERLHNHNKAKHNKTVCIFLGIYCTWHFKIWVQQNQQKTNTFCQQ